MADPDGYPSLPPGQQARDDFPRFGLNQFANRFPADTQSRSLHIAGDVFPTMETITLDDQVLAGLQRSDQLSDFHCVTTWSKQGLRWSGLKFTEVYQQLIAPLTVAHPTFVLFHAQDGYRVGMQMNDLMATDVLFADTLDGAPLPVAHGAPRRLVAPAHYGFKNIKHLSRIEFFSTTQDYRRAGLKFMDHPRARVAVEERGTLFPGILLRYLYRPLISSTVTRFANAITAHGEAAHGEAAHRDGVRPGSSPD